MLEDKEHPAAADVFEHTKNELAYMAEYLNRTGDQWMSYYGPEGPRAPPVLFMWPADEVGQVHRVVSNHGFW